MSLHTPIRASESDADKENTRSPLFCNSVAELALRFNGNSTVKSREHFFQTLMERRKEELKCSNSAFKSEPVGDAVKSMASPVRVEFMKAWVEDVIANGGGEESPPDIRQAEQFLAEFGVKETIVGEEEWRDWSEAMRVAQQHGKLWESPVRDGPLSTVRLSARKPLGAYQPDLDSSIDAYSICISPTKTRSAAKNDVSFDIDEGSRYTEHMMSQYPEDGDVPNIRGESMESINLNNDIVCPVVRFPQSNRHSVDSAYTEGGSQAKSDVKRAPKTCFSWFKCF